MVSLMKFSLPQYLLSYSYTGTSPICEASPYPAPISSTQPGSVLPVSISIVSYTSLVSHTVSTGWLFSALSPWRPVPLNSTFTRCSSFWAHAECSCSAKSLLNDITSRYKYLTRTSSKSLHTQKIMP